TPDDLQLVDVRRIDLIQRRVLGAGCISAVRTPFAVSCSALGARDERPRDEKTQCNKDRRLGSSSHLFTRCALPGLHSLRSWPTNLANFLKHYQPLVGDDDISGAAYRYPQSLSEMYWPPL